MLLVSIEVPAAEDLRVRDLSARAPRARRSRGRARGPAPCPRHSFVDADDPPRPKAPSARRRSGARAAAQGVRSAARRPRACARRGFRDGVQVTGLIGSAAASWGCEAADEEIRARIMYRADGAHARFSVDARPKRTLATIMGWWENFEYEPGTIEMVFDRTLVAVVRLDVPGSAVAREYRGRRRRRRAGAVGRPREPAAGVSGLPTAAFRGAAADRAPVGSGPGTLSRFTTWVAARPRPARSTSGSRRG